MYLGLGFEKKQLELSVVDGTIFENLAEKNPGPTNHTKTSLALDPHLPCVKI